MAVTKEFIKTLDKYGNERLRIKLTISRGKLVDLVFQYESFINAHWREIVRYDLAHGFFHRDVISTKGLKEKIRIEMPDLKSAATFAEQDIKDKCEFYKIRYLKDKKKNKMTNREAIKRNIELTFDFVRQIIDDPKIVEDLPEKCEIDFIEKDFSSKSDKELAKKRLIKVGHTFEIIKKSA